MKINCSQNYYYQTANNTNMVKQQKSPAFGELHFSGQLINFFRSIEYPPDKLFNAKMNTENLSKTFFNKWLNGLKEKMYNNQKDFDKRYDIVAQVCKDVSKELFKNQEVKPVLELAQHDDVKEIAEKHVNNFEREAKKTFRESSGDFDFDVYYAREKYKDANPLEIKIEVLGFGRDDFNLDYNNKNDSYLIDKFLSRIEKGTLYGSFHECDMCDEASKPVKDLDTLYKQVKKGYTEELHTKIKSLARSLSEKDEYLRLY